MAKNLVKIKDVCVYTAVTEDVQACFDVKRLLNDHGVKFTTLHYNEEEQFPAVFDSLGTWTFTGYGKRVFNKFPIVHWTNCYDDFTTDQGCATSVAEIKSSNLLVNKTLVG